MRALLGTYRIEIKYALSTVLILGALGWVASHGVLDGLERTVNSSMDRLVAYGHVGLFVIALLSNVTLIFIVPYALPLFTLATYAESSLEVVLLGVAAGLGAGLGELLSYTVAHTLVRSVDDLEKSAFFQWGQRMVHRHPRLIPVLVWLASGTPLPDMIIVVPLALIKYPWRKIVIPMLTGKIFQNVVMALVYRFAADYAAELLAEDISFDITANITIIFVMFILYQIAKTRADQGLPASDDPAQGA